jgi:hypothetical protein
VRIDLAASQKRPKQQAAKLQAGLLAAKGAPRHDGGDAGTAVQEAPDQAPPADAPKKAIKADDILYRKGDATAATFRPWYWSYEHSGEQGGTPPHDASPAPAAPQGEAPPADAKLLQERLAEAAATALSPEPPPAAEAPPPAADLPPPAAPETPAAVEDHPLPAPEPALAESRTEDQAVPTPEPPAAEIAPIAAEPAPILAPDTPATAEDHPLPGPEPALAESRTEDQAVPTPEPLPAETSQIAPETPAAAEDHPLPALEPPPVEAPHPAPAPERGERPHQRARRALREQAAAETAAPPPAPKRRKPAEDQAAIRAAEEEAALRAAEERAAALAEEERIAALAAAERAAAALAEEERAAAARAAEDARPASPDELATTIETVMNRRRYTDPVEPEKAARGGSGQTITGNSLLAELQAAREARGSEAPKLVRESDAASSVVSSRSLLDRVLTYGGIALILVVAFLALSPAGQYAPVARLTHLFN